MLEELFIEAHIRGIWARYHPVSFFILIEVCLQMILIRHNPLCADSTGTNICFINIKKSKVKIHKSENQKSNTKSKNCY